MNRGVILNTALESQFMAVLGIEPGGTKLRIFVLIMAVLSFLLVTNLGFAAEWTGLITETHCGAAHRGATAKDVACIKKCVAEGMGKLALLVDNNVFTITNPEKATGHEGENVKVTGTADEVAKTVTIDSLTAVS